MSNIDRINANRLGLEGSGAVQKREELRASMSNPESSREDSVELSGTARNLDRLSGLVHQTRSDRFAELQQLLASGDYRVSGTDIASKLIESHRK